MTENILRRACHRGLTFGGFPTSPTDRPTDRRDGRLPDRISLLRFAVIQTYTWGIFCFFFNQSFYPPLVIDFRYGDCYYSRQPEKFVPDRVLPVENDKHIFVKSVLQETIMFEYFTRTLYIHEIQTVINI